MANVFLCRSINLLRPKEETLSRHSILGPNGLHGRWQPPSSYNGVGLFVFFVSGGWGGGVGVACGGVGDVFCLLSPLMNWPTPLASPILFGGQVQYPSNIDLTPIEMPR